MVLSDNRVGGDQLAIARSASFADKNAGMAKAVTVGGLALSGRDAGNYVIAAPTLAASAAITPKALAASVNGVATKVYDGNNRALLAAGQVGLSGFVAGEGASVGALNATYDSANVLQAATVQAALPQAVVSAAAGTQLANYLLPASVRGAGAITPKALTVVGMRANAKVYDGNTTATLASIGSLDGLLNGDSLQLSAPTAVRFDTRNAASGKTVTASGYGIANGAAGLASNYTVANSASATDGSITQATLTVKANDASRPAGLSNPAFGFSVSGLLGGDSPAILPEFALASSATPAGGAGQLCDHGRFAGHAAELQAGLCRRRAGRDRRRARTDPRDPRHDRTGAAGRGGRRRQRGEAGAARFAAQFAARFAARGRGARTRQRGAGCRSAHGRRRRHPVRRHRSADP